VPLFDTKPTVELFTLSRKKYEIKGAEKNEEIKERGESGRRRGKGQKN
jgi:hypothetical protein